ncbi:PREDICTED: laminin subunit gamma-3 [Dipodomys ordii]|uniref:Laminin subunit gamma-3 n=1 Tax=Dipodomys ordii TaxID=10020 RepID=A0A1S3FJG9_DIPOR|nr:PREDICTED: laminin subunit gamma-3 [Dipodomys ordii]
MDDPGGECWEQQAAPPRLQRSPFYLGTLAAGSVLQLWGLEVKWGLSYSFSLSLSLSLGKAYEITYVRLKFHTSRPESFAIYKRSRAGGPWEPYQYYSASCQRTYGRPEGQRLRPGQDERVAFCTSEFSDISPLSGGNVAFSTLEGRPSAYNFEESPGLQDWVTSTELLISLDRLNTFGDDIFKDPKVLQSYYYAVSDFSVGGSCRDQTTLRPQLVGSPCPKLEATGATLDGDGGQGGPGCATHAVSPPHSCPTPPIASSCRPCMCSAAGSLGTCDPRSGHCPCKDNVEGNLCDRCRPGTFNLQPYNPTGCTPCFCFGHSTVCAVAPGFQTQPVISDFRQGADGWRATGSGGSERSPRWSPSGVLLGPGDEELRAPERFLGDQRLSYGQPLTLTLRVPPGAPPPPVRLKLGGAGLALALKPSSSSGPPGAGQPGLLQLHFLLQETSEDAGPPLPAFHFQRLLTNLTVLGIRASGQGTSTSGQVFLTEVQLPSVQPGPGPAPPAAWVEACSCPRGYTGQFCESCAPGYKRETPQGGPYTRCVPCTCNQHGTCNPNTGVCLCGRHTEGPSCERCAPGFHGNAFTGRADACQPCPCPGRSACTTVPDSGEVVCTHCPPGQRGRRCEQCEDGFFGDPLGGRGAPQPCRPCPCSGNVDPNAVGNCDPQSGRCLRCLHNTTGPRCERCREGFYGSALALRPADKCTPCSCHPGGSASELRPCHPVTGQCTCLSHVTGRDCGHCRPGFYDLQPGRGCQSCKCHPLGSQENRCHPETGQCPCRPGVTGQACDRCQLGFFSFSAKGCRACRCSPLGAASAQCHENSTCVCRPGFAGYKCDRCQSNFFLTADGSHCQECPACYALVEEGVAKLKARLALVEEWLQGSDCSSPWEPLDILQEETPRGDAYQRHLLPGAREAFLLQMTGLGRAVRAAGEQLRALDTSARCDGKTCSQLADLRVALAASEEEILQAASVLTYLVRLPEGPGHPTNWSHLATEARAFARSHRDTAAQVEAAAQRALLASNTSALLLWSLVDDREALEARRELEDRYQEVQAAQHALDTAVAEVLPEAKRVLATVQHLTVDTAPRLALLAAPGVPPQKSPARDLGLKVRALEQTVAWRERAATKRVEALQASARTALQETEPLTRLRQEATAALTRASAAVHAATVTVTGARTLLADLEGMKPRFPQPRDRATLQRKASVVRGRLLADTKKKTKQAERMLGNAASLSSSARKKSREAELLAKDNAKLSKAVLRAGKRGQRRAGGLASQAQATLQQASWLARISGARRRELEAAEQVSAGLSSLEQHIRASHISLEKDIKALSELLARLGSLDTDQAPSQALNETQRALDSLRLQLGSQGALHRRLQQLEQESEQQKQQIQDFENDLTEIRADKQNLEAILHSLPEPCSSWQ